MCIFCKIIKGEIPSYKVLENDEFLAFLDISQATPGHTLVIPKVHYSNITTMPSDLLSRHMAFVQEVIKKISMKLKINDFNVLNNCGVLAGQSVEHYHIHIIPRYKDDELNLVFPSHDFDSKSLENIHSLLK